MDGVFFEPGEEAPGWSSQSKLLTDTMACLNYSNVFNDYAWMRRSAKKFKAVAKTHMSDTKVREVKLVHALLSVLLLRSKSGAQSIPRLHPKTSST